MGAKPSRAALAPSRFLSICTAIGMAAATLRKPIALLLPDPDTHTKLKLNEEGLELLRAINDPVAIISVVGAYRTGKSWLLNELMQIGCGEGFVVGHERHAQTKGIWLLPSTNTSSGTIRVFMDTEGMDASGQTEVYDDRIFAFAALISSVLVYNLAETIKQADIERLAFAAQLSNEFWRRATQGPSMRPMLPCCSPPAVPWPWWWAARLRGAARRPLRRRSWPI